MKVHPSPFDERDGVISIDDVCSIVWKRIWRVLLPAWRVVTPRWNDSIGAIEVRRDHPVGQRQSRSTLSPQPEPTAPSPIGPFDVPAWSPSSR